MEGITADLMEHDAFMSDEEEEVIVDGISNLSLENFFAEFEENIEWGGEEYSHSMDEGIIWLLHYYYLLLLKIYVMVDFCIISNNRGWNWRRQGHSNVLHKM